MLRFLDAGETHGKCLTAIIEGLPAGLTLKEEKINSMLALRQQGYGRGGRMKIETDRVEILSGVRGGTTLGSPVALRIENRDFKNWSHIMGTEQAAEERGVYVPRPGHADLSGALKYGHRDMRNVLERASARETAIRTAVGAVCEALLEVLGVRLHSRVVSIGGIYDSVGFEQPDFSDRISASPVRMYSEEAQQKAMERIDRAKQEGESLGGVVEVVATGMPPGVGSYVHYDRKLDARLAGALMSVQAIKGVEFGAGFRAAQTPGSKVHDAIREGNNGNFIRLTNNAGGIEGGMSNGEPIVMRAAMKPIPTLYTPLESVDIRTGEAVKAAVERSDICAVPACSIVCEAVAAFELANAVMEKFGGDSMEELKRNYSSYLQAIKLQLQD